MDPEVLSKSQFYILLEMLRGNILRLHHERYFLFNKETKVFAEKPSSTRTVDSLKRQDFIAGGTTTFHLTLEGREKIQHEAAAGVFK